MNFTSKGECAMRRYLLSTFVLLSSVWLSADDSMRNGEYNPFNYESDHDFNGAKIAPFEDAFAFAQNNNNNNDNNYNGISYQRIGRFSDEDSFDISCVKDIIAAAPTAVKKIIINLLYPPKNRAALPKRLLLCGKPGTGKTTLAKAIAYACGYDYYLVEAPFLLNEYKNSGPQNLLREIYPLLTAGRPVVVILDELTELTDRYKKENDSDATVAAALWILLDSCAQFDNVFFIGTSNKAKKDLPAQLQSRFDEDIVMIHMPHAAARKRMLQHHLKGERHKIDAAFLYYLVKKTDGRSAREIEKLVFKAIQFANVHTPKRYTVTQKDFERALKLWKPFYHPEILYQKIEPHLQPFFKTAFPIILQTIGLIHNIYSGERGFAFQKETFEFQKKAHNESMKRQKEFHDESIGWQKYSAQLSTASTVMQAIPYLVVLVLIVSGTPVGPLAATIVGPIMGTLLGHDDAAKK
jgi:AAA+ superfamily predicted ATPase